ncbi:fimbrial protein [Salmonella enterica]|nr:fimbrial protein [Salmonella enterica]
MQPRVIRGCYGALCGGLLLCCQMANASCSILGSGNPTTSTFSIPALIVDGDAQPGEIFYSTEETGEAITVSCDGDGEILTGFTVLTDSDARTDNPLEKVYQTNVPGVGIRLGWAKEGGVITDASWVTPIHVGVSRTQNATYPLHSHAQVQFIVTGPISNGSLDTAQLNADWLYAGTTVAKVRFSSASVNVRANTCNLMDDNILAPLETITSSELANGVSRVVSNSSFSIQIENCSAGTQVDYQFTSSGSTSVTNGNILHIEKGDNAAEGVGIQILDTNNNVLQFDTDYTAVTQTIQNQLVTIPLKARYVKTGTIKAGKVDAVATFSVYYR